MTRAWRLPVWRSAWTARSDRVQEPTSPLCLVIASLTHNQHATCYVKHVELKTYRVINEDLVRQLALQLGLAIEAETTTESEFKGGIANFGAARRRSQKINARKLNDPRLLEEIVEGLRKHGQLKTARPERMRDLPERATFVREVGVEGTPVYLPVKEQAEVPPGIAGLTVWVFEPLGSHIGFIDSEPDGSWAWDWLGTYLFLVEEHLGDSESIRCWSGISALRLLVDGIAGHDPKFPKLPAIGDRYGRDDPAHPIDKLRRVGGVPLRQRRVEIVYRIAEMTNEQATTIDGKEVRLNDILAYPLYIADS